MVYPGDIEKGNPAHSEEESRIFSNHSTQALATPSTALATPSTDRDVSVAPPQAPPMLNDSLSVRGSESGLGSSTLGSHRSMTLSVPTTPHAIRQKPPTKPPRLKSATLGSPPQSPAPSSDSSLFDEGSLGSFPVDAVQGTRVWPVPSHEKVHHILTQTRDILIHELDAHALARPLRLKQVLDDVSVTELFAVKDVCAANNLLIDMILGMTLDEMVTFCEIVRTVTKSPLISDLLLTLDCLLDLRPEGHVVSGCSYCVKVTDQFEDFLSDKPNYDVEVVYVDQTSGDVKTLRDVSVSKRKKREYLLLGGGTDTSGLLKFEVDQYILVVTVSLYNYCLYGDNCMPIARALDRKHSIRELSLARCHLNSASVHNLKGPLQQTRGLAKLDLRLNPLHLDTVVQLSSALGKCGTVRILNLSSTDLICDTFTHVLASISRNQATNDLDIGFNDLRNTGCDVLADSLQLNCPLKRLRVRHNGITAEGAFRLFRALKKNSRLAFLDISCNELGNKGMSYVCEMLRYNRTIRQMNLENCGVSVEGCECLVRALRINTTLRALNLSMNRVGDDGIQALAEGLKYNQTLNCLSLNMCGVTNTGLLCMLNALQYNMSLQILKLCYNKIGYTDNELPMEFVLDKLCHVLQHNKDLKVLLWGNRLDTEELPEELHCEDTTLSVQQYMLPAPTPAPYTRLQTPTPAPYTRLQTPTPAPYTRLQVSPRMGTRCGCSSYSKLSWDSQATLTGSTLLNTHPAHPKIRTNGSFSVKTIGYHTAEPPEVDYLTWPRKARDGRRTLDYTGYMNGVSGDQTLH